MTSFWPKSSHLLYSIPSRLVRTTPKIISPSLHAEPNGSYNEAKQNLRPFWTRKWLPLDVLRLVIFTVVHLSCLWAPFHFTWPAFWVFIALHIITAMFGVTLSFHRHLTHRSFTLPKWLEYIFAYCGTIAFQGNPIDWVSTHRYHHKFTDSAEDPHSPIEGFWFSHMNWVFDRNYLTSKCGPQTNVDDLKNQFFYRFIEKTYYIQAFVPFVLLYFVGGVPFVLWGGSVRGVALIHITFMVNSVCHIWGKQKWNTGDLSRNNWLVGLLAFGEGWHNNHHAFQSSARHGFEWWEIDMTWGVIKLLEAVGLATNVKLPSEGEKKRKRRACS